MGRMFFLSADQQCQTTEENNRKDIQYVRIVQQIKPM